MKNFEGPYGFTNDKSTIFFFHFNSDQSELTNRVGIGGGGALVFFLGIFQNRNIYYILSRNIKTKYLNKLYSIES